MELLLKKKMSNRLWKVVAAIGPYDGPHADNITTYKLSSSGVDIFWHQGPNKKLNAEVGDVVYGISLYIDGKTINYKKSEIIKVILQNKLF